MISQKETAHQVTTVINQLVSVSLCDAQNYPTIQKLNGGATQVTVKGAASLAIALKNIPYRHIYKILENAGAYHLKMIDGSLVQMLYAFQGNELTSHRLAVFPSPDLENFQRDPQPYLDDDIFTEIVSRHVIPFPIRFDYNSSLALHREVVHPKSHLTLGQYQDCRIPVSAPLSPFEFATFLIRNFYNTSSRDFLQSLSLTGKYFEETISPNECHIPHFRLRWTPLAHMHTGGTQPTSRSARAMRKR